MLWIMDYYLLVRNSNIYCDGDYDRYVYYDYCIIIMFIVIILITTISGEHVVMVMSLLGES